MKFNAARRIECAIWRSLASGGGDVFSTTIAGRTKQPLERTECICACSGARSLQFRMWHHERVYRGAADHSTRLPARRQPQRATAPPTPSLQPPSTGWCTLRGGLPAAPDKTTCNFCFILYTGVLCIICTYAPVGQLNGMPLGVLSFQQHETLAKLRPPGELIIFLLQPQEVFGAEWRFLMGDFWCLALQNYANCSTFCQFLTPRDAISERRSKNMKS